MIEFEVLAEGCYQPEQLVITYNPLLRMPTTFAIQQWMDDLWAQKLLIARQKKVPLFDAPLFRLIEASAHDDRLFMTLGNTGYKEYVTTRTPEFAQAHTRSELGNALGVCSVVETSDGYILLDKRQGVDVYVGRYHVIGGFFERELDTTMATQPDPFAAIRREIREETGIQASDITEQYCLGVVYDLTTPHGEICFLTRLAIPLEEALKREPEEDEIKQLHTLHVTEESLKQFIIDNHGNISVTGEPNLLFYGKLRFGELWFEDTLSSLLT